ncbi:MAG TPA: N-acetylmuramic acid 6-phosphate etherase [Bryobacteraceae bacterium]|jgi:N-acetylmuramic acid 6-phosphate etherase|nr:N-acetylmuramic acid 6-phosphate etherase [Bryobacteraceae bacterium]
MSLDALLTEQLNPASRDIDTKPTAEILRIMNDEDGKIASAVASQISPIAKAVDRIVEVLRQGGRLFYIGAGTSGRLGVLDAAECPPTFNVAPDLVQGIMAGGDAALAKPTEATEDDPETGKGDLERRGFTARDALVGIAASGRTPYVLGAVAMARALGALTIGISCTPDSELARVVEIAITPLCGPEVIAGSTRLKAGTATKLVLNMISTAVMIRLGHVYGNLMVNVAPRNRKLEDRARRIIAQSASVSPERAGELLKHANGNVKTAIVMARLAIDRAEAEAKLAGAGGRIAEALKT